MKHHHHCAFSALVLCAFLNAYSQRELTLPYTAVGTSPLQQAISTIKDHRELNADDKKIIEMLPLIIQQVITKNNYSFTTKLELELLCNFMDVSCALRSLAAKLAMLELVAPMNDPQIPAISTILKAVNHLIELDMLESEIDPMLVRACNTNALIDTIREKINSLRELIIIQFTIVESIIETIDTTSCCAEINSKIDILISKIDFILTASCDCQFF